MRFFTQSIFCRFYSVQNSDTSRIFQIINDIKDTDYFKLAFTHKSIPKEKSYETLEFLGDSILQIYVSIILHHSFPNYNEGELTQLRSDLVNTVNLSKISLKIGLHNYLKINKDVDFSKKLLSKSNTKILADIYESFIGALYLTKGKDELFEFISLTIFEDPKYVKLINEFKQDLLFNLPVINNSNVFDDTNDLENFNKLERNLNDQMRDLNFFLTKEFNNLNLSIKDIRDINQLFLELVSSLRSKSLNQKLIDDLHTGDIVNNFNKENQVINSLDKLIIVNNMSHLHIRHGPSDVRDIIASNLLKEININQPSLENNKELNDENLNTKRREGIDVNDLEDFSFNQILNGALIVLVILSFITFSFTCISFLYNYLTTDPTRRYINYYLYTCI